MIKISDAHSAVLEKVRDGWRLYINERTAWLYSALRDWREDVDKDEVALLFTEGLIEEDQRKGIFVIAPLGIDAIGEGE